MPTIVIGIPFICNGLPDLGIHGWDHGIPLSSVETRRFDPSLASKPPLKRLRLTLPGGLMGGYKVPIEYPGADAALSVTQ